MLDTSVSERFRVVRSFAHDLLFSALSPRRVVRVRSLLFSRVLACHCAPLDCHASVLAVVANGFQSDVSELCRVLAISEPLPRDVACLFPA